MVSTFICHHCGREVPHNPRIKKKQKYCSEEDCQRARIRFWKKRQYSNDDSYRKKCLDGQKVWRKHYPSDQYQRAYREKHPDYVKHNREKQRERNKRFRGGVKERVVKTDAILLRQGSDGNYTLTKINRKKIVNRNALSLYPFIDGAYVILSFTGKKIVNSNALMAQRQ